MENWSFSTEQIHTDLDLLSLEHDTIRVRVHNKPCELIRENTIRMLILAEVRPMPAPAVA